MSEPGLSEPEFMELKNLQNAIENHILQISKIHQIPVQTTTPT